MSIKITAPSALRPQPVRVGIASGSLRCQSAPAGNAAQPRRAAKCSEECSTSEQNLQSSRREVLGALAALLPLAAAAAAPGGALAEVELPSNYASMARSLVAALRDSIDADLGGAPEREIRRRADPAKELVKQFMGRWRDTPVVRDDESYRQLTAALQELGQFYQAQGQRTRLSERVGQSVLAALDAAEGALPPAPEKTSLLPF